MSQGARPLCIEELDSSMREAFPPDFPVANARLYRNVKTCYRFQTRSGDLGMGDYDSEFIATPLDLDTKEGAICMLASVMPGLSRTYGVDMVKITEARIHYDGSPNAEKSCTICQEMATRDKSLLKKSIHGGNKWLKWNSETVDLLPEGVDKHRDVLTMPSGLRHTLSPTL